MSVETLKLCSLVVLLAPLTGAILAGALGPVLRGRAHWPAIFGVGAACEKCLRQKSNGEYRRLPTKNVDTVTRSFGFF